MVQQGSPQNSTFAKGVLALRLPSARLQNYFLRFICPANACKCELWHFFPTSTANSLMSWSTQLQSELWACASMQLKGAAGGLRFGRFNMLYSLIHRYRGGRAAWLSNVADTKALTAEVWGDWWDLLRTCLLPWSSAPPSTPPPPPSFPPPPTRPPPKAFPSQHLCTSNVPNAKDMVVPEKNWWTDWLTDCWGFSNLKHLQMNEFINKEEIGLILLWSMLPD